MMINFLFHFLEAFALMLSVCRTEPLQDKQLLLFLTPRSVFAFCTVFGKHSEMCQIG